MTQEKVYTLLKRFKTYFTKQEYLTIKGQIKSGDFKGAYKGIIKRMANFE